jgi:hypothetical protein
MIKVYFGPFKHSPAPELKGDERRLWLADFCLLRGYDRDFWTANPMTLDFFSTSQIMLWHGSQWVALDAIAGELAPKWQGLGNWDEFSPGALALACVMILERDGSE